MKTLYEVLVKNNLKKIPKIDIKSSNDLYENPIKIMNNKVTITTNDNWYYKEWIKHDDIVKMFNDKLNEIAEKIQKPIFNGIVISRQEGYGKGDSTLYFVFYKRLMLSCRRRCKQYASLEYNTYSEKWNFVCTDDSGWKMDIGDEIPDYVIKTLSKTK